MFIALVARKTEQCFLCSFQDKMLYHFAQFLFKVMAIPFSALL